MIYALSETLHSLNAITVKAAILTSTKPFFCAPLGLMGNFPYEIRFSAVLLDMPVRRQYSSSGMYGSGITIVMLGRIMQTSPVRGYANIHRYQPIFDLTYNTETLLRLNREININFDLIERAS